MFEQLLVPFVSKLPEAISISVGAGLFRNLTGYLGVILEDGKITKYEITKLGTKLVQYISAITLLSFGLPIEQCVAIVFAFDLASGKLKRIQKPVKK